MQPFRSADMSKKARSKPGPSRPAARKSSTTSKRSSSTSTSSAAAARHVFFFGNGKADGNRTMKELLGGKGAGLAEMTNAGLPVPPGFTISTAVCNIYYREKGHVPSSIDRDIQVHLKKLEQAAGATLGSTDNPLLVS